MNSANWKISRDNLPKIVNKDLKTRIWAIIFIHNNFYICMISSWMQWMLIMWRKLRKPLFMRRNIWGKKQFDMKFFCQIPYFKRNIQPLYYFLVTKKISKTIFSVCFLTKWYSTGNLKWSDQIWLSVKWLSTIWPPFA